MLLCCFILPVSTLVMEFSYGVIIVVMIINHLMFMLLPLLFIFGFVFFFFLPNKTQQLTSEMRHRT